MLKLNILKNITLAGQIYKSGDSVEAHKTLLHYETQEIPSSLQILLDAGLISSTATNTYKVVGDIVVTLAGQNYAKNSTFVAPKAFAYVDVVDYPKWIAEGVTKGLWTLDDGIIHVSGVTLTPATFSIDVGNTQSLAAAVLPANAADKTGAWASSDVTVATVDNAGLVTALKAGTANITFTTTDGAKVGTSAGTITIPVVVPTSVTVSPASPTTTVGGTVKLSAAITPAGATDKSGVWASATPAVATVAQDGTVTGVSAGTSVVSFTTNSGAKTANRTVTVS
jgi:hypothetical protein